MTEEEVRALIEKVLSERTMPDIFGNYDPTWLVPIKRFWEWTEVHEEELVMLRKIHTRLAQLEEQLRQAGIPPFDPKKVRR